MRAILEWIDDVIRMMDNRQCFENPHYSDYWGDDDTHQLYRTKEFLKNIEDR